MISLLRDTIGTWTSRARYHRLVNERLLQIAESDEGVQDPDEAAWRPIGQTAFSARSSTGRDFDSMRERARKLVDEHPYAANLIRLLEIYVAGPGLQVTHRASQHNARNSNEQTSQLVERCDTLWREFVRENAKNWSYREHGRRAWRDGEAFVRKFPAGADMRSRQVLPDSETTAAWPPRVRFVEPAQIAATPQHPDSQGVLTASGDVETPVAYLRHEIPLGSSRTTVERVRAESMHHTRYGADSNERRGRSLLAPVLQTLEAYDRWLNTELQARRLQASIVLWRKVHGSPQVDSPVGPDGLKRERVRPGTIVTTSPGTELEFLQPKTNFGDAVNLGRQLLLAIAAGVGVPEYMLTADASNANFASTMVAEGPAVKLFQALQTWLADDLTRYWRWIMEDAIEARLVPKDLFDHVQPEWTFPTLVARDRPAERMADVALLEQGVLSRAEVARRDGVDPQEMQSERLEEETDSSPSR